MTVTPLPAAFCLASLLMLGACSETKDHPAGKMADTKGAASSTSHGTPGEPAFGAGANTGASADTGGAKTHDSAPPASGAETKADATTGIRSVYSSIKAAGCKTITTNDEAEYREQKCTGFAGTPLYIKEGDLRADIDAGAMGEFLTPGPFNAASDTIEWRVGKDGQPFAIIFRLTSDIPDQPKQSWLMVETVGKGGKPSCRLAEIAGATRDANQVARDKADAAAAGQAKCMTYE